MSKGSYDAESFIDLVYRFPRDLALDSSIDRGQAVAMGARISASPGPAAAVGRPLGRGRSARHHEPANAEKREFPWH